MNLAIKMALYSVECSLLMYSMNLVIKMTLNLMKIHLRSQQLLTSRTVTKTVKKEYKNLNKQYGINYELNVA